VPPQLQIPDHLRVLLDRIDNGPRELPILPLLDDINKIDLIRCQPVVPLTDVQRYLLLLDLTLQLTVVFEDGVYDPIDLLLHPPLLGKDLLDQTDGRRERTVLVLYLSALAIQLEADGRKVATLRLANQTSLILKVAVHFLSIVVDSLILRLKKGIPAVQQMIIRVVNRLAILVELPLNLEILVLGIILVGDRVVNLNHTVVVITVLLVPPLHDVQSHMPMVVLRT